MGIFTTQLAALKFAIKDKEHSIECCYEYQKEETDQAEAAEWQVDIDDGIKELKLLKSKLTRIKNIKNASKVG